MKTPPQNNFVNVKCEFSDVVSNAFRKRGIRAYSYDFKPSRSNHPDHRQMDCRLAPQAALTISHPECTHLAVSGARWFSERRSDQREAIQFFLELTRESGMWAIENPIGIMSTLYRKPDQIIQPWMFGHGETKATCLWLKGLPKLVPTNIVAGRQTRIHYESPGIVNGLTRKERRSITFQGIADAMAEQWGKLIV